MYMVNMCDSNVDVTNIIWRCATKYVSTCYTAKLGQFWGKEVGVVFRSLSPIPTVPTTPCAPTSTACSLLYTLRDWQPMLLAQIRSYKALSFMAFLTLSREFRTPCNLVGFVNAFTHVVVKILYFQINFAPYPARIHHCDFQSHHCILASHDRS